MTAKKKKKKKRWRRPSKVPGAAGVNELLQNYVDSKWDRCAEMEDRLSSWFLVFSLIDISSGVTVVYTNISF